MYEQDKLMDCNELAKYLGVTPDTLGVYRTKGVGPKYIKIGSEYVFASRGNIFQGVQDIRKPFQWAVKKVGLPQVRIYDLRHSFITMGANTGQNMVAMRTTPTTQPKP